MEKKTSPIDSAIAAAREFKLLLDVQAPGTLLNPGGKGDARESATYAIASLLLAEATAQRIDGRHGPSMVHSVVMPVIDVVSKHCTNMPADLLELLTGVTVILDKLGLQVSNQDGRRSEQGGSVEIAASTTGNSDVMVEHVDGELDTVHTEASEEVVEQTLCHGDATSPLIDSLMKAAFDRPRDPRSDAYKLGARTLLVSRSTKSVFVERFAPGSIESDAFHAGVDEGRAIWASHQAKASQ